MDFIERLEHIINKSGLKKNEFAIQCGVSRTQLFRYLKSQQEPGTIFYRNLKINFPWVDLGWLISGISDNDKNNQTNNKFVDTEKINSLNSYLFRLESNAPDELNEVEEFIKYRISVSDKKKNNN